MTVGELEHGRGQPLSSYEFSEWKAFFAIENDLNKPKSSGGGGGSQDFPGPEGKGWN